MLNRAARYFPILREIRRIVNLDNGCRLVEIGSGSIGIGEFWSHPFIGCDVRFENRPRAPMQPVACSGTALPFPDRSFDVVLVSDVLEHVPPALRTTVVSEALRVARSVAVIACPYGPAAFAVDKKLHTDYLQRKRTPPVWLQEHLMHPFPAVELLSMIPDGWAVKVVDNETVDFHYWMMRAEMHRPVDYLFRFALALMPGVIEAILRRFDGEPSYRRIVVLSRP